MMKLQDIAIARSGDKGDRATLSVIARDPANYPLLERLLTAETDTPCPTWAPCPSCCTQRWAAASRARWRSTPTARR